MLPKSSKEQHNPANVWTLYHLLCWHHQSWMPSADYKFVNRFLKLLFLRLSTLHQWKHQGTLNVWLKYAHELHIKHTDRCSHANSWAHNLVNKQHLHSCHGRSSLSYRRTFVFQNPIVSVCRSDRSVEIPDTVVLCEPGLEMDPCTSVPTIDTCSSWGH